MLSRATEIPSVAEIASTTQTPIQSSAPILTLTHTLILVLTHTLILTRTLTLTLTRTRTLTLTTP